MRRNAGFTLVEVSMALAVGGLVVLAAHQVLAGVLDASERAAAARTTLDREANAHRLLSALFGNLEIGSDSAIGYAGRSSWLGELERDEVRFGSWVEATDGWFDRAPVVLAVVEGRFVVLVVDTPVVLADSVTELGLDHLMGFGAEERWVANWVSSTSAPVAVRVRLHRGAVADTALYYVGTRG